MQLRNLSALTVLATLLALPLASSPAGTLEGVTMPDRVAVDGKTLVLNGLGLREVAVFNLYVAGLYLPERTSDPKAILAADEPKRLTLTFLRSVDNDVFLRTWNRGFRINAADQLPRLRDRIDRLNEWMPDMKKGESLTFTYRPGVGTEVVCNGKRKGVIEGRDFGQALFSIWLGKQPPNPELKRDLLGQG